MKSRIVLILFAVFYLFLIFVVFREWFTQYILAATDLPPTTNLLLHNRYIFPFAWDPLRGTGMGGNTLALLWNYITQQSPVTFFANYLNVPWAIIERLLFFYPFLLISFFSSYMLCKRIIRNANFAFLGPLVYLFNTYILLVIGGGQVMIALAYALIPIIILLFKEITDSKQSVLFSIFAGVLLTVETLLDFRIAFIGMFAIFIYWLIRQFLFEHVRINAIISSLFYTFLLPGLITGFLNAFWLLPVLLVHQNPVDQLGSAYSTLNAVTYFSFAKFENTIALLHPYWPDNIFGKVSFMRPEFLLVPIVAFSSLLFVPKNGSMAKWSNGQKKDIIYFSLLGLIGAFLAKGANDPFGGLYLWFFSHIPGFIMFRDPTKWYVLVAVSYSILIPYSVWKIYEWLKQNAKSSINFKDKIFNVQNLFVVLFIIFWLFTIRQAVEGQLSGTFISTTVPSEYASFGQYLSQQPQFYRTLWVPTIQQFGYYSDMHPQISAQDFFAIYDEKDLLKKLKNPDTERVLEEMGVKYVIVPTDSQKEIFLKDHVYSDALYRQTVSDVSKIPWLQQSHQFSHLAVFTVSSPMDHFWSPSTDLQLHYSFINPVTYHVTVTNAKKGERVVFAESFDPSWVATKGSEYHVVSSKYQGIFNSFILPKDGSYAFEVYYEPQQWVDVGLWITLGTLVVVIGSLVILLKKSRNSFMIK